MDTDPLFVGGGDYHLSPASPCANTGTDAGVTADIDGEARPSGAGYDMGSDEAMGVVVYVPDSYATIQAAINAVSDGDTIILRDGTFSGPGNRNINFKGKAIWLRSENGPGSCTIDAEDASRGVIFLQGETVSSVLDGVTITNGNAFYGGGIYCVNSSPTIQNCIVEGSAAEYGGGVCLSVSDASLTNCTVVGNTANEGGGGIFLYDSDPAVKHCTIADNSAFVGGAVDCYAASPTITNSILWGNAATYGSEILVDAGSTLTIDHSDVQWSPQYTYVGLESHLVGGIGNINSDPLFAGGGDYHLTTSSPCIDAGTSAGVGVDIDGDTRPGGSASDMGSDEYY